MQGVVDVHELKDLLQAIAVNNNGISIRLRLIGQPEPQHFADVLVFAKHALLLVHMPTRTVLNVPDLNQVTSFTLNRTFECFSAFQEYRVIQPHPEKRSDDGLFHDEYTL